jgi:hypothetical protein
LALTLETLEVRRSGRVPVRAIFLLLYLIRHGAATRVASLFCLVRRPRH